MEIQCSETLSLATPIPPVNRVRGLAGLLLFASRHPAGSVVGESSATRLTRPVGGGKVVELLLLTGKPGRTMLIQLSKVIIPGSQPPSARSWALLLGTFGLRTSGITPKKRSPEAENGFGVFCWKGVVSQ